VNLQEAVAAYIKALESPPNGLGQHYLILSNGAFCRSDNFLGDIYAAFGRDKTNAELDRQFNEREER
jgi:hypothetical protein